MKIKRVKPDCWPRLVACNGLIDKEQFRALQSYAVVEVSDEAGAAFIDAGLCVAVQEGEGG